MWARKAGVCKLQLMRCVHLVQENMASVEEARHDTPRRLESAELLSL